MIAAMSVHPNNEDCWPLLRSRVLPAWCLAALAVWHLNPVLEHRTALVYLPAMRPHGAANGSAMARGGVALPGSGLASLLCRPTLVFLAPFRASAATEGGLSF
jgi:hypothetical protein